MNQKPITTEDIVEVLQDTIHILTESEAVGGIVKSPALLREIQVLNAAVARVQQAPEWIPVAQELPDEELTVLISVEGADDPVWVGFMDSGEWRYVDAMPVLPLRVTHWAELPEPPAKTVTPK